MSKSVIIIGAGLAGLCCARKLQEMGVPFTIFEAADAVGGRIRTDVVEGFRLDRGFQVFLDSYPEARSALDFGRLDLHSFTPGALIRHKGAFHKIADPWSMPLSALSSLFSPVGTFSDKLRVGLLRARVTRSSINELFEKSESSTIDALKRDGFSDSMIERFFRPFMGGIFLDADLRTSSRMFDFVFKMFSSGRACLPAKGMEVIPQQIAATLPSGAIRLNTKAAKINAESVILENGEKIATSAIVVATEAPAAARLLGDEIPAAGQSVKCIYFDAAISPVSEPILVLNGDGSGPINNLCVPTEVTPSYGPSGRSLISVTVLKQEGDEESLVAEVKVQLKEWFGKQVDEWRHLRTYDIPYALPRQFPPVLEIPERDVRHKKGIYVCGDHMDNASINGAMVSGRRAAEAVMEDLNG